MNEAERCNDDAFIEGKKKMNRVGNTRIVTSNMVLHVDETFECLTSE